MAELKPCPKCGGDGIEKVGYGYPIDICGISTGIPLGHVVVCEKCGYNGKFAARVFIQVELLGEDENYGNQTVE